MAAGKISGDDFFCIFYGYYALRLLLSRGNDSVENVIDASEE
jgi:hypothetical protein